MLIRYFQIDGSKISFSMQSEKPILITDAILTTSEKVLHFDNLEICCSNRQTLYVEKATISASKINNRF